MKNISLIFFLFSQFTLTLGQTNIDINAGKYAIALHYIQNASSVQDIKISGNIVDLDRWVFPVDSLEDYPEEKKHHIECIERQNTGMFEEYSYSKDIAALTSDVRNPQKIVYFSKIKDNMLVGCIVPFDERIHCMEFIDNYDIMCRFCEADCYLFLFDIDNKIKKVIRVSVIYDF